MLTYLSPESCDFSVVDAVLVQSGKNPVVNNVRTG